jgi:hypothetical protein
LDPGSGIGKNQDPGSGIRDKHPGSATLTKRKKKNFKKSLKYEIPGNKLPKNNRF